MVVPNTKTAVFRTRSKYDRIGMIGGCTNISTVPFVTVIQLVVRQVIFVDDCGCR